MSVYVVSDLHLHPSRPNMTETFLNFLKKISADAKSLYLLGDIFEVWIGDDENSPWLETIKSALQQFSSQGISIYLMHGNRDFLIGKHFLQQSGCQLLTDPNLVTIYDKKILMLHGDTLCLDDHSYLRFRRFNRCAIIQKLFLTLPLKLRRRIAKKVRTISAHKDTQLQDITPSEIPRLMKQYHADILIHGHTHRPAIHYFNLDKKPLQHIVLSDWHQRGNALKITPNQPLQLYYFCSTAN